MRFNPLWLIALLFLLPGFAFLLLPLLLIFVFMLLLSGSMGGGAFLRAPGQLWKILTDRRARADLVLAHAVCCVLGERFGVAPSCWTAENGFFLPGLSDENGVYEAAEQALARLKRGEEVLKIYPNCPVFRALSVLAAACVLLVPLAPLGLLALPAALACGYFAAPYLSPWLQKLLLTADGAANLSVFGVRACAHRVSLFGGRMTTVENGVEVSTSAQDVIEAEIIEE